MKKVFSFVLGHKFLSLIVLVVILGGSYYFYQNTSQGETEVSYATSAVKKGTLISSISGIGQVSASNQVELKTSASGKVVQANLSAGQSVYKGQTLVYVDATDALKVVRDAKTSLETAELELDEILESADELSLLQSESSLISAQESKEKAIDNLDQSYESGFNTISNTFLDMPGIMTGLDEILFSSSFNSYQVNIDYYADTIKTFDFALSQTYRDDAYSKYQIARTSYDASFANYKLTSRFSEDQLVEDLILESYETVRNISEAIKSANNLIRLYQDELTKKDISVNKLSDTHLTNLSSYTSKTNSFLSSLLSSKSSIQNHKESITSAERSIKEKELSLIDLKDGADELTIRAKEIAVQQKKDALSSAQQNLADYAVTAPFAGVIAEVNVVYGDSVSSNTQVATLITEQKIAEITLNEIDAAKIEVGQKVNLEFDAIEDLSITGEVVEVDAIGKISSNVVSYDVKIGFDVQDDRIKSGMSVSASIIIESKQNILLVPISAVKTMGTTSYVEVLVNDQAQQKTVITGSSNDTMIEIVEGLEEGEQIITQTISGGSSSSATSNSSTQSKDASQNDAMRNMMKMTR